MVLLAAGDCPALCVSVCATLTAWGCCCHRMLGSANLRILAWNSSPETSSRSSSAARARLALTVRHSDCASQSLTTADDLFLCHRSALHWHPCDTGRFESLVARRRSGHCERSSGQEQSGTGKSRTASSAICGGSHEHARVCTTDRRVCLLGGESKH